MNLLQLVQHFCRRQGLSVPTAAYASTDPQIIQIIALLQEVGDDMVKRGPWEGLQHTINFNTVATAAQPSWITMGCIGFDYMFSYYIYDYTSKKIVAGPVEANEWQYIRNAPTSGPRHLYRIQAGGLVIHPVPAADLVWTFDYVSKWWKGHEVGGDPQEFPAVEGLLEFFDGDTNVFALPSEILMMGLRAKWKQEKGLAYAQDRDDYEKNIAQALSRDGGKSPIDMGLAEPQFRPGIFIPEGNWNLP